MDMKRLRSPRGGESASEEYWDRSGQPDELEKKRSGIWPLRRGIRPELVFLAFLMTLPLLFFFFGGRWSGLSSSFSPLPPPLADSVDVSKSRSPARTEGDKLLGGLLSPDFEEKTCLSRYQLPSYRRPSPFSLSPYLQQKLREYEAYHRKCGPGTKLYRKAIRQLKSGRNADHAECKYVAWFPCNGLGNRMLTLSATFLYALLTNRVLLASLSGEAEGLFCEPFPSSSWVLPADFPHNQLYNFHMGAPESYANMLKNGVFSHRNTSSLPAYVYLHLEQSNIRLADNIFCSDDQSLLSKFNWMLLKSDSYFVPGLFLVPSFRDELHRMFPEKESVFHHLGRYIFHPTNRVWGIITRYYRAYLANADDKLGLQIRIFPEKPVTFENMYDQVVRCILQEHLLPEIDFELEAGSANHTSGQPADKLTAVLITSLYPGYYDKIRGMYYENPTKGSGGIVAVHQPSHEEMQKTEAAGHNQKALAEIYLLSLCDRIVITAWSTFGYVAHSLAGTKPWIFLRPDWDKDRAEIPCLRSASVEPCLHSPPSINCGKEGANVKPEAVVPHVRHCEDVGFGLKLFD